MDITKKFKEFLAVLVVIAGLIVLQWRLWITHELIVTHDSIIWYGAFSYFVDCVHQGFLPLWNPYMNCGENFFLNLNPMHLLEPSTILLTVVGKLFRIDYLVLYHYDLLLRYIIFISGAYLFFRYITKYRLSAFIALITISFSSLCSSYLKQNAFLLTFYLLPWFLLFVLKFLEERNQKSLLWIAIFLGIILQSYHSMFVVSYTVVLMASLFLSRGLKKQKLRILFSNFRIIFISLFIFILLVLQLLPFYLKYRYDVVPTVRIFEAPIAANSYLPDFLNLLIPYSFPLHFFNWMYMSESFLYISLIPLLLAILGLLCSRHRYKIGFISTTIIVVLLMLGDLYPLFARLFPFFSVIRNMSTFGPFFIFCLVYFTAIGADVLFEAVYNSNIGSYKKPFYWIAILMCGIGLLANFRLLKILPSIIGPYHILNNELESVTADLIMMLRSTFYKSDINILFFAIGCLVLFSSLESPKVRICIKQFILIFFILVDLFSFSFILFKFVTMPRGDLIVPSTSSPVYNNFRLSVIRPQYPFYAFAPSMYKIFTAYSTKIPWKTTHFYEMKDFYEFIHNAQIPLDIKNVFMGITAPKLRLAHQVVVLPRETIIEKVKSLSVQAAKQLVFIEEHLPAAYAHLEHPLDNLNEQELEKGRLSVIGFSPNEIVIDVYAEQDCLLYYSDGFDSAWRVFVDGKKGRIYEANLAFKAVIVDKGYHVVRFAYDPKFYKFGLVFYLLGLLSSIILLFWTILTKLHKKS